MKVWRNTTSGLMFHDKCFEKGEDRVGFYEVAADEIADDDECESCGAPFIEMPDDIDEVEDDDDEQAP